MGIIGDILKRAVSDDVRLEDNNDDFSQALRQKLHKGVIHFIYRKKVPKKAKPGTKGELRDAWGTLEMGFVPEGKSVSAPMGYGSHNWTYIDLESDGWRSAYILLGAESHIFSTEEYERLTDADKAKRYLDLVKKLGYEDEIRPTAVDDAPAAPAPEEPAAPAE